MNLLKIVDYQSDSKLTFPKWLIIVLVISTIITLSGTFILPPQNGERYFLILIIIISFIQIAVIAFAWIQIKKQHFNATYDAEIEKYALLKHFEHIIMYANDIIIFFNEDNLIIEANDRAFQVYGYTREEMLLLPIEKLTPKEKFSDYQERMAVLSQQDTFFGEALHIKKDGTLFPVEISSRVIVQEGKRFIHSIIRDISDRKEAEKAVLEREQMLKQQNEEYISLNREFGSICEELSEQNEKLELLNEQLTVSEKRFRLFMDHLPGEAFIKDSQSRLLYANKSFEEQMGLPFQDMVGKTNQELFPPRNAYDADQRDQNLLISGKSIVEETEGVFKENNLYLTSRFLIPQYKNSPLIGCIILDITETRRLENELFKLTRAVEQSPVSIVITDINGDIEYINPKFTEVTGYSSQEAIGNNPRILKSNGYPPEIYKNLWDTITSGKDWKGEFLNKKKNGELYWENASISPVFDKNGKIINYIALKEDITKQKLAEQKLEENQQTLQKQNQEYLQLNEELHKSYNRIQEINKELMIAKEKAIESDKLKSAFLANLSHEIRTPMNGIIGFSEMLALDNLTVEKRKHYTEVIINSTNQLLSIVNDVLDLSKIETGQISLTREQVKLNKLLIEIYSFFKQKTDEKNIEIEIKKGLPDNLSTIMCDKMRLNQIMSNLISNAIKFTKQGKIILGYELKENFLQFFIEDSGIGIPEEFQHRLFGRFQQANVEISRQYGGTGLGLAISKSLVELLGGKIWFTSTPGLGSTFYFTIPYLNAPQEETIIPTLKSKRLQLKTIERPLNILLVEDEEINSKFIIEIFDGLPVTIFHGTNGVEAIELCKLHPEIDIILMDIKMPIMNGYEATKHIKKFRPNVPVIALTAYAMKEDKILALSEGCDDYLSKPVKSIDLIQCILNNLHAN